MTELFDRDRFTRIVDRGLRVWSGMPAHAYEEIVRATGTRPGIERLASECGITSRSLKRMTTGEQPVSRSAAEKVAMALPVSIAMLHDFDYEDTAHIAEVLLTVEPSWGI